MDSRALINDHGQPRDRAARELVGTVDRILWASPHEAVIAKLRTGEVVRGPVDEEEISEGLAYRFLGQWQVHPRHGDQFSFETFVADRPHSRLGVVRYLESEAPNVGRKRADQLWERFGEKAVEVLRENPGTVAEVGILTAEQAEEAAVKLRCAAGLEKTKIDLFSLFAGRGFSGRLVAACIREWGAKAAEVIRRNPYIMLVNDMPSAGFKRCDKLYLDLGYRRDRLKRQMLCGWYHLREDTTGHTWFRLGYFQEAIEKTVRGPRVDTVAAAVMGKRGGWISTRRDVNDPTRIWVAEAEKATKERQLADAILRLQKCQCRWPKEIVVASGQQPLTEHQLERAYTAMTAPVCVLNGSPGTGKTFTAAAIIRQLVAAHGAGTIAIAAPTGKAAVRITAAMQRYNLPLQATTIHRLLGVTRNGRDGKGWGFTYNSSNFLPYWFVVIDESSMLDANLASDLICACADRTHVLLIGDTGQLPPVGHGAPLRDMVASGVVPVGELTEIQRNAGMIVRACADIKTGADFKTLERKPTPEEIAAGQNLLHYRTDSAEQSVDYLRAIFDSFRASSAGVSLTWDIQVLVGVNDRGDLSRERLNALLQGMLNPCGHVAAPNPFRIGDKIICLKNGWVALVEPPPVEGFGPAKTDANGWTSATDDHGEPALTYLANGEIGEVVAVAPRLTVARFPMPDRTVKIPMGKHSKDATPLAQSTSGVRAENAGGDFDLAYAVTVHKAQGSEAPIIIVFADDHASMVASREWWYTAISRARDLCVLIGKEATIQRQCKRVALTVRKTFLTEMLQGS